MQDVSANGKSSLARSIISSFVALFAKLFCFLVLVSTHFLLFACFGSHLNAKFGNCKPPMVARRRGLLSKCQPLFATEHFSVMHIRVATMGFYAFILLLIFAYFCLLRQRG